MTQSERLSSFYHAHIGKVARTKEAHTDFVGLLTDLGIAQFCDLVEHPLTFGSASAIP